MGLAHCDHCERAFRTVRWIDLRTGDLATPGTFEHGEKAQLCWDCHDAVRERLDESDDRPMLV